MLSEYPTLPPEAPRAPRATQNGFAAFITNESNFFILGAAVMAFLMLFSCVSIVYVCYRTKYPSPQRGHVPNFVAPARVQRNRVPFARALRVIFSRVIVTGDATPEDQQPIPLEVVGGNWMIAHSSQTPVMTDEWQVNLPGSVAETDEDVSAQEMAPKRKMSTHPRHAMWTSAVGEDTADTVTTERLGTIMSPRLRASRLAAEYPTRTCDDSVFDATTEAEPMLFDSTDANGEHAPTDISTGLAVPIKL